MDNVVLIGMPGSGKSTIGVVLAKVLGYDFIDSDLLIQKQERMLLSEIMEAKGIAEFIEIENQIHRELAVTDSVIATGGSVIYGAAAMENLSKIGKIVYLKLSYQSLKKRLGNLKCRGVVLKEGQTLQHLYEERIPLYEKYADITIDEEGINVENTLEMIVKALKNEGFVFKY